MSESLIRVKVKSGQVRASARITHPVPRPQAARPWVNFLASVSPALSLAVKRCCLMAPSRGSEPLPRALHITLEKHRGPVHVARYAKGIAKYVLTGGQDRVVRLWNPNLGTEIKTYSAHGYEVLSISV